MDGPDIPLHVHGCAPAQRGSSSSEVLASLGLSWKHPPRPRLLIERVGGQDVIKAVAEELVQRVTADPRLAHHFAGVSHDVLTKKMRMMLESMFGGADIHGYDVKSMHRVHRHLKLMDADFDAYVGHVAQAVKAGGVEGKDADEMVAEIAKFRDPVLGRGAWSD